MPCNQDIKGIVTTVNVTGTMKTIDVTGNITYCGMPLPGLKTKTGRFILTKDGKKIKTKQS